MTPDVHALTGPFVLNALPDDERHSFEQHLADCQSCQAEVAELRETASKLATAVATEPPASLKAKVLAAAEATRQLPPSPDAPASHRARPGVLSRRSLFGLAAAGVAVAGTGAIAIDQYRDAGRLRRQNDQIAAILGSSDARMVHDTVTGGGQATVVRSVRRNAAVVLLQDLRQPPDGRTYQLWLIDRSQTAHSIGLADGGSSQILVDGGVTDKVAFGLTIEPTGGSPTPTLPTISLVGLA